MITEATVRAVRKPQTARLEPTRTFRPLEHFEVLDLVEGEMNKAGLVVDNSSPAGKRFTLVDGQAKMVAVLPLTLKIDDQSRMMVGIMNSWNKTLALRVGFGAEVFVCSNGSIFATEVVGRKHTTEILADLPTLLAAALSKVGLYADAQCKFFERLRNVPMTDNEVNDFVVRSAIDHDCITGGEIIHVINEWRNPRFDEFKPRTAYSLHNAYTEISKRIAVKNGGSHAERTVRLSQLFVDRFAADLGIKTIWQPEIEENLQVLENN